MARRKIGAGSTSNCIPIFINDTSSTTGAGLSIVFNTSGLVAEYRREGQSTWTAITPVAGTLGTFVSGGLIADGALTGAYEFCPPDVAFAVAAGVRWGEIRLRGVANMLPVLIEFELDALNYQDGVRLGMTSQPNAIPGAAGGHVVAGTGTNQLSPAGGNVGLVPAAITPAVLSPDAMALLSRGFLTTTGVTVPATADIEWTIASTLYTTTTGTIAATPYYVGKQLGLFIWTDGTFFYLTSTAPGVALPSAYWKTASGAGATGPYTVQGTATGVPTVLFHGNSVLNAIQPNSAALAATIITQLLTDLFTSSDFTTAASLGALFKSLSTMIAANQFTAPALALTPGATLELGTVVGTPTTGNGQTTFDCTGLAGPASNYLDKPMNVYWQTGPNGGAFPVKACIPTPSQANQFRLTIDSPGNAVVATNTFDLA